MRIRIDFVTNSSSSNFILAHNGEFTEKQKNAGMKYIFKNILGEKVLDSKSTDEEIREVAEEYDSEEKQKTITNALKSGKDIYAGTIDNIEAEGNYYKLLQDIWHILEKNGDFKAIQADLTVS